MSILHTLVFFLIALAILVVVHEYGHYIVAKLCGVKVLRFSLGMGKIVWSRRMGRDDTEWAISILPIGGYVKLLDAREQDLSNCSAADLKREFTSQPVWKRIAIVAAGPVANFLLAICLFTGIAIYGVPEPVTKIALPAAGSIAAKAGLNAGDRIVSVGEENVRSWEDLRWALLQMAVDKSAPLVRYERVVAGTSVPVYGVVSLPLDSLNSTDLDGDFLGKLGINLLLPPAVVEKVSEGSPGAKAGMLAGDRITSIDDHVVTDAVAFVTMVRDSANKSLKIGIHRGQQDVILTATPLPVTIDHRVVGQLKVALAYGAPEMTVLKSAPVEGLQRGVRRTWETTILTFKMLGKMATGQMSLKNITGPLTIADYAGKTASLGILTYLTFIAFISISLGAMNLLPIPMLDGGLLLYYSLEVLTGRTISERFGAIAQRAGMGLLMALMAVAFFNDITRLMF